MKMRFHSHVNLTHFHMNGCAPGLGLIERLKATRKWAIAHKKTHSGPGTSPRVPRANSLFKLTMKMRLCHNLSSSAAPSWEHRLILVMLDFLSPVGSSLHSSWTGGARTRQVNGT